MYVGPSTITTANTLILNGLISPFGVPATSASQCLVDFFRIPGQPIICGQNTGEHGNYLHTKQHSGLDILKIGHFAIFLTTNACQFHLRFLRSHCDLVVF